MGSKGDRTGDGARTINVEIAPGNKKRLDAYIREYNSRPDRRTPKVKYTDVLNSALDGFLERHLPRQGEKKLRSSAAGKRQAGRKAERRA